MLKGRMYHFNGKIKLVKQGDNISVGGAVNFTRFASTYDYGLVSV